MLQRGAALGMYCARALGGVRVYLRLLLDGLAKKAEGKVSSKVGV